MVAPRRSRRRIGVLAAASWLGAVVLTGTVAWRAVAVLDTDTPRTGVLSTAEVSEKLASAQAAAATASATPPTSSPTTTGEPTADPTTSEPTTDPTSASPTSTPSQTPTRTPSPSTSTPAPPVEPAPTEVTRTWQVTGGTVSAACTGQTIRKVYATPQDGWTVETGSSGPEVVEVELHRGEQETKVTARCVDGTPAATISSDDGDEHDSEHDD